MEQSGQELVVMVGLQAAGKSTYCRRVLGQTHVVVSKDNLRNNRRRQRRQLQLIEEALASGRSVVVDNTHASLEERAPLIELARQRGLKVRVVFLDTPMEVCDERNAGRTERERVPDVGLYSTRKKFVRPRIEEGMDEIEVIPGLEAVHEV